MKVITTHYIDGKIVEPHGRGVMDSINPSNNTVIGRVTLADEEDAKRSDQNRERFPIRPSCLHKRDDLQRARRVASQILAGRVAINGDAGRSSGALGRFQALGCRSRIRSIRNRGFS